MLVVKVLITYDLRKPGQDYQKLYDAICSIGQARKILQSVWVVKTSRKVPDIQEYLSKFIDSNDKLFVTQFAFWSGAHLSLADSQWLRQL